MDMQYVKLNNGIEMPQVGLGTFLIPKDKLEDTLIKAYDMGYRQFEQLGDIIMRLILPGFSRNMVLSVKMCLLLQK